MSDEITTSDISTAMQQQDLMGKRGMETDRSQFVEKLLRDKKVEKELEDFEIWAGLSNSAKLSFLEPNDESMFMDYFEYSVCLFGIKSPHIFREVKTTQKINQARIVTLANLKRAIGTNNPNKKNERIAVSTERRESIAMGAEGQKPNVVKRLFGFGR